jgi:DNA-binding response OmpR family regulator
MNETVLLVEDSEDDVFFMVRAMKNAQFKGSIQVAKNGQVALDYLGGKDDYKDRSKYPSPRLVLLDLKLPHVLGLDVLKWIRGNDSYQTLPVVILSSSGERTDLEKAYRMGANSFLVKPSDSDDLQGLANCLKDYWFKYNLLPKHST